MKNKRQLAINAILLSLTATLSGFASANVDDSTLFKPNLKITVGNSIAPGDGFEKIPYGAWVKVSSKLEHKPLGNGGHYCSGYPVSPKPSGQCEIGKTHTEVSVSIWGVNSPQRCDVLTTSYVCK